MTILMFKFLIKIVNEVIFTEQVIKKVNHTISKSGDV